MTGRWPQPAPTARNSALHRYRSHMAQKRRTTAAAPVHAEQHADIARRRPCRHEAQPHRKDVAEHGARARPQQDSRMRERHPAPSIPVARSARPPCPSAASSSSVSGGKPCGPGAQDIGRADVAGADLAHIAEASGLREQQAERDRAEQIADSRERRVRWRMSMPCSAPRKTQLRSARRQGTGRPCLPATSVRNTRPCILLSSNGVFLERDRSRSLFDHPGLARVEQRSGRRWRPW